LDCIGTGFVHGLAGGDVGSDFFFRQGEKADAGDLGGDFGVVCGDDGDTGDDAMGAARKKAQHAGGVVGVDRFGQDLVVDDDGGVRTQGD